MSSKDAHLYGQRPASRTKTKAISSTSTLAFSSTLSSLIKTATTSADPKKPAPGRSREKKEDIFSTHNKNVKKRALKDLEDSDFTQMHRGRTVEEKDEDEATWRRAKRRMEEKARLYDALKRGDVEDLDDKYGVDFDRKWAEAQEKGEPVEDSESHEESAASEEELIEYTDEFGRSRKGTRAEIARQERMRRTQAVAAEPDRFTARPSMPDGIILGDTIQAAAFNPDATIAEQMAALAAKRDKELTPPPDEHFDANREKRQRGTGFFQFSKDEEERKEQMANLEKERLGTEKARENRKKQLEERKRLVEERRRKIKEKRAKGQADRFLDELGVELFKDEKE
ncbi:hypothetical protein M011DRAFT_383932, partial [Sporormia fimetaria CBS 119925]